MRRIKISSLSQYIYLVLIFFFTWTTSQAQYTPFEDDRYDVHFYHIDIEVGIDTSSIIGNVQIKFSALEDDLGDINIDMSPNLIIDSIPNISTFTRTVNHVNIQLENTLSNGESFSFKIYYHATDLSASFKGVRYEKRNGIIPVIATLSTPYLAHIWYPCKDGTKDKVDSVYLDIKIENQTYDDTPIRAVSNGLLHDQVDINGTHTQFRFRHLYPIVPYYVMFAISNYIEVTDNFTSSNGVVFPIELNTFPENQLKAENLIEYLKNRLPFFESHFGVYPFNSEKLGYTELGFYGGIEDQTNIVLNRFDENYYSVAIHELAHMWFACSLTCEDWHQGWLNEGFATYLTGLNLEDEFGQLALNDFMVSAQFYNAGTINLENIDNPFNVFTGIIYNKGAWVLHMTRALLGDDDFFSLLLDYSQDANLQYGNVNLLDFQSKCETLYGSNLDWFFQQWIFEEYYPDLKYNFNSIDNSLDITLIQNQVNFDHITFDMPLEIEVIFSNGTSIIENVWIDDYEHNYHFDYSIPVSSINLDPRNVLLDKHALNTNLMVSNEGILDEKITISPNPVSDYLNIETNSIIKNLFILSADGKRIDVQNEKYIDLSFLNEGVYFLYLLVDNHHVVKKIIKK